MTRPSRSGRPARSGASGAASAAADRRQRAVGPAGGEGRAERKGGGRGSEAAALLRDWISRPLFDYHVLLAITALLTGIGLVTVADLIGRTIIMPFEVPVSLILGIAGSAFFVFILLRRGRR